MIIVQRVGRVNRIGNDKDVYVLNFTPSREIEIMVGILSKLKQKIEDITLVVGKESKILSQEEEISVETFGERIKSLSELSMTDLEEFGISDEFKHIVGGGMPQEQVDEYKLWNIIQYELDYTDKDFEEVKNLEDGPYYTYIQSGNGKIFSIYEFYRGDFRIDRKIMSTGKEGIKQESPLALLELVRGRKITPFKLDESAEKLKEIDKHAEKIVEKLRKEYQPEQKGFLYNLYNALVVEREKGRELENYKSVLNTLQLLQYQQYSRDIKSLLVERKLVEVGKNNNVKILNLKGVVNTLYSHFLMWGLAEIPSLKVEKKHIGWFYAQ